MPDLLEDLNEFRPTNTSDLLPVGAADQVMGAVRHDRRLRWIRIGALSTAAVLFATMAVAVGYAEVNRNQPLSSASRAASALPTGSRQASAPPTDNSTYTAMNILLMGSDSRGSSQGSSDTYIVLHLSADRRSVYLVSFPRDMWVTVPGYGKAKIDAGYSHGGAALAVSTIEALTGARIDHVVTTDFAKFAQLVDSIGPVTIDNPVASVAHDAQGHTYPFPKGPVVIADGNMALAFVGQRDELPRGELDRTLRQRTFLRGLALTIGTPDVLASPVKLKTVIATIGTYVTVDSGMTNDMLLSLGLSLTGLTNASQIHLVEAPTTGSGTSPDGQSIDVVDVPGNAALGKALQTDSMPAFVAAYPSTEYGSASATATATASKS